MQRYPTCYPLGNTEKDKGKSTQIAVYNMTGEAANSVDESTAIQREILLNNKCAKRRKIYGSGDCCQKLTTHHSPVHPHPEFLVQ